MLLDVAVAAESATGHVVAACEAEVWGMFIWGSLWLSWSGWEGFLENLERFRDDVLARFWPGVGSTEGTPVTLLDLADTVRPGRTALIFQEVQNGVVGDQSALPDLAGAAATAGLIPNCVRLADSARRVGVPVIHTTAENLPGSFGANHNARLFAAARKAGAENKPGSRSVRPVEGVCGPDDVVLPRYHGLSPMTGGPLDSLLRNAGITTVVLAGVSLNVALPNLTFDAVNRAYQVVIARDAVAGVPAEYGEQIIRNTLRLIATVCPTEAITRAWDEGPE